MPFFFLQKYQNPLLCFFFRYKKKSLLCFRPSLSGNPKIKHPEFAEQGPTRKPPLRRGEEDRRRFLGDDDTAPCFPATQGSRWPVVWFHTGPSGTVVRGGAMWPDERRTLRHTGGTPSLCFLNFVINFFFSLFIWIEARVAFMIERIDRRNWMKELPQSLYIFFSNIALYAMLYASLYTIAACVILIVASQSVSVFSQLLSLSISLSLQLLFPWLLCAYLFI